MGKKGSHLSDDTRDAVCKLLTSGNNVSSISKMLAVPRTTISTISADLQKNRKCEEEANVR